MPKPPAVREHADGIEIDVKRGRWPYLKAARLENGDLGIFIDANEGGQVIGSGVNLALIQISAKKAKRLAEFILRTHPS